MNENDTSLRSRCSRQAEVQELVMQVRSVLREKGRVIVVGRSFAGAK
jgi:hypothetical protein